MHSAKGLKESAERLSKTTGKRCLPAAADVRDPEQMGKAVAMTMEAFGRIDYVICGEWGFGEFSAFSLSHGNHRAVSQHDSDSSSRRSPLL